MLGDPAAPKYDAGPIKIYVLADPRDQSVRYVGKTTNAARRLRSHCTRPTRNERMGEWISKLALRGLTPTMVVVGNCLDDQWETAERAWIAFLRVRGRILNVADGGRRR